MKPTPQKFESAHVAMERERQERETRQAASAYLTKEHERPNVVSQPSQQFLHLHEAHSLAYERFLAHPTDNPNSVYWRDLISARNALHDYIISIETELNELKGKPE